MYPESHRPPVIVDVDAFTSHSAANPASMPTVGWRQSTSALWTLSSNSARQAPPMVTPGENRPVAQLIVVG